MKLLDNLTGSEASERNHFRQIRRFLTPRVILIILALIIIASPFLYIMWQNRVIGKLEKQVDELVYQIENPLAVNAVTPLIVVDIVESGFNGIDELSTVEYLFTDSGRFSDSQQIGGWNIPLTEKSFSLKWNGVIKAGINLHEISCDVTEDTITISIPSAKIFSYEIDEDSVEILDERNNVFNPISVEDKVKFDAENERFMKQRAIDNGLLEKAQENAGMIIQNMLIRDPRVNPEYNIEFIFADNIS